MFKVIVADNHDLFRTGVVKLLSSHEDFRLIAQFSEWAEFLRAVATNRESLIIISTSLIPELAHLVDRTRAVCSRVLLIADDLDSANGYRSSGVAGVVHRSTSASAFLDCLGKILRGVEFVSPSGAASDQDTAGARTAERLTAGELKVVALLMQGMRYKNCRASRNCGASCKKQISEGVRQNRGFKSSRTCDFHFTPSGVRISGGGHVRNAFESARFPGKLN
jgi:DNA-binding NarL/FixJ family response regulator